MVKQYLKRFTQTYSTHLTVSPEAMQALQKYQWDGNLIQLENFCERLFITTHKKNIDEGMVNGLLEELYPHIKVLGEEKQVIIYKYPEASDLVALLKKHKGNHKAVAEEMKISATTLWRRMKKYGITSNYETFAEKE